MRKNFDDYGDRYGGEEQSEEDAIRSFLSQYEGKSEQEVLSEILYLAKEGRQNGTLSDEEIDRYVQTLSPMLGESQRKKLQKIAEKLKRC